MSSKSRIKTANILRYTARSLGLIFGMLIFIFALASGAEYYGNDFWAFVKNSPNAFPWLLYLVVVGLAWKKELAGGLIILVFGIFNLFFFGIFDDFLWTTIIIVLLVILNGLMFIGSWWLRKT